MKITAALLTLSVVALAACDGTPVPTGMEGRARVAAGASGAARTSAVDAGSAGDVDVEDAGAEPDAGPPAATADASADASVGPSDPFAGAVAYVAQTGPSARKAAHPFTNDNPAGRPCFNCHGSTATAFAFAGTVYLDAAGTQPAPQVEVRMRDAAGKGISAWTDGDGNFFFPLEPNGDLGDLAATGLRNADGTTLMSSTVAVGNCNGCHRANAVGRLVAPK